MGCALGSVLQMAAWFKQKRYGYGAAPSSWQGWAITIAYTAIVVALSVWLVGDDRPAPRALAFFGIVTALTILLIGIVARTTEGGLRWRWGDDEKR